VALRGSLKDFGLADILQLIHFQGKSGVLTLEGEKDRVKLFFVEGNIVGAISRRRQEDARLGKILLKRGYLKEEDLQEAIEEQARTGKKLGSILLQKGFVDKEIIKEVLTGQITETVVQIFGWEKGTYEFTPQVIALDTVDEKEVSIILDTQHLLMEGLRILDEWSLLEGKLTLDTVFVKKTEMPDGLSEEEMDILSIVDGENDLSTIIDISGKDGFEVATNLVSLMEKGIIEPKSAVPVIETPKTEKKRTAISYSFISTLVIILAIIVSILSMFFSTLNKNNDVLKGFIATKMIENLKYKIETYRFQHNTYPDSINAISNTLDPWGRPYIYYFSNDTFTIKSLGPDGKEGTEDDIY
jgi:competence protein ComGC